MAKSGPKGPIKTSFKKGQSGNPNGRPKGSLNKSTKAFREVMQALLEKNEEQFSKWIERIARNNPDAAFGRLMQAAEFTTPKLSRVTHAGDSDAPILYKEVVDNIPDEPEIPTDTRPTR